MKIIVSGMFIGLLLIATSSYGDDGYYRAYPKDVSPPSGFYEGDSSSLQNRSNDQLYPKDISPPSGYYEGKSSFRQHRIDDRSYPLGINPPSGY